MVSEHRRSAGAECDVQSHLYSYSFEGKPDWSQRYAGWREIQQYILDTTQKYGLRRSIRFGQQVCGAHFDATTDRWTVDLGSGATLTAWHFVLATGPLHVPQVPEIPGLERFQGKVFHSARWDHDYDLAGKRVASIGTGGSAIQYCPEIAPIVQQLYVFQRTAAWVTPRDTRPYSEGAKRRFSRHPWWRKLHHRLQARAGVERLVSDVQPAERRAGHGRHARGDGGRHRHRRRRRAPGGLHHPRDGIRHGPADLPARLPGDGAAGPRARGRLEGRAEAYYGVSVAGYPNLHMLLGPNTGLGHNSALFMIECQVHYVLQCLRELRARGADSLEVYAGAQARFNERVQQALVGTVWGSGCRSWYQSADGRNFTIWPWSTWRYWLETRKIRAGRYRFGGGAEGGANQA